MGPLELLVMALIACCSVMTLTFLVAKKINNYSIVDIVWSGLFSGVALIYFIFGQGSLTYRALMLGAVLFWSVRLCAFLARRIMSHHPHEDERYQNFRKSYADNLLWGFFKFYQIQALSVVLLSFPFLAMATNVSDTVSPITTVGLVIFLLASTLEGLSDRQKRLFKAVPGNKDKNCEIGLWSVSRHPNYFFEIVLWVGLFAMGLDSPYGIWGLLSPLGIGYLLVKVTGIPLAEQNGQKKYGPIYEAYQKRVSILIPWFPKS